MIDHQDVRAAVSARVLTEAQAAHLIALAEVRRGDRQNLAPGDEPFELFKGFNEVFIVVGLTILAFGWISVFSAMATGDGIVNVQNLALTGAALGAALVWLLSEYFIRRRRMVGPANVLSVFFAIAAFTAFIAYFGQFFMLAQMNLSSLPLPMALGTLAAAVFWWRFKVPFSMAVIAVSAFALAMIIAASNGPPPENLGDLFLLSANGPFAWITLALGLAVFATAMYFDMSDPHRVTRRSAQGFWLHVVAAPALINTISLTLMNADSGLANLALAVVLALIAMIAIIIDRRSFLIAAIGYIVALAGTVFDGDGAAMTILILGVALVLLGAMWERIRAVLLRAMPAIVPVHRLPPASALERPND